MSAIAAAVDEGVISERVWLYAHYDCNLACAYCLTGSSPTSRPRQLTPERMLDLARQASEQGFRSMGVTGGEPFLRPWMVQTLVAMAAELPVLALSNATLFGGRKLQYLRPLARADVALQFSLDRAEPETNDASRARGNHRKVVRAIADVLGLGIRVRVASTVDELADDERAQLVELVRSLGVAEDDHIIRPIVKRGRAVAQALGLQASVHDLRPELTISADGAFWGPFGPTVADEILDTDLLLCRRTSPLSVPAGRLLALAKGLPDGHDSTLGIR